MIPKDCNCLAEVDFPIAMVSKHSARDLPAVSHIVGGQDASATQEGGR